MLPEERAQLLLNKIYHQPGYEGDYQGFLKQPTLYEAYAAVRYAEGEQKFLWALPGHGKAYEDCGSVKAKGCDKHEKHESGMDFVRYFKRSCRRKGCPTCYESWGAAEAERSLIRYATFKAGSVTIERLLIEVKKEHRKDPRAILHEKLVEKLEIYVNNDRTKPIHVVFSPPPGTVKDTVQSYKATKKTAYRLAREHGLFGGSVTFHPYRLKCDVCGSAIPDYNKECSVCRSEKFSWFWSPHFHALGFGWIHHTKEGYEKHGWVIKNLGVRKSVFWTLQYLLSHAGVSKSHATTWFGKLAYNKIGRCPILGSVPEICPFCESPLLPFQWIRTDRPPPLMELNHDPLLNQFLAEPGSWRRV